MNQKSWDNQMRRQKAVPAAIPRPVILASILQVPGKPQPQINVQVHPEQRLQFCMFAAQMFLAEAQNIMMAQAEGEEQTFSNIALPDGRLI